MPNHDHTVGWANSSGSSRLRVPITSTPASSKQIATQAVTYQPREPAKTRASVARMYTAADAADSEYARGASSKRWTIWTKERPVAASAMIA